MENDTQGAELIRIHYSRIRVEESFNPRDYSTRGNKEHVATLSASILEHGQLQPIVVAPPEQDSDGKEYYPLRAGESRLRAVLLNVEKKLTKPKDDKAYLEAVVRPDVDEETRLVRLYVDNTGKPFEPLESAELVARLEEQGLTQKLMATRLGVSHTRIQQLQALNAATDKTKDYVRKGHVAAQAVIDAMGDHKKDAEKVEEVVAAAIAESGIGKTRQQAVKDKTKATKTTTDDPHKVRLSAAESRSLGLALSEAWALTSAKAGGTAESRLNKIRKLCANVLEDVTGLSATVWAKASEEEEPEED